MNNLKFYGHSCFSLTDGKTTLLFDPFLTDNPFKIATPDQVNADYILVSHGHADHLGDTVAIAKRCNTTIISTAEVCRHLEEQGCKTAPMHIGGKINFPFGTVRITLAFHGSGIPGGHACGFVVDFNGQRVYFAGDTGLFLDMKLIGELEAIDYALLPIGNNYTMGVEDAAIATEFLKPKNVVPMHYNTWPPIAQDPHEFEKLVNEKTKTNVIILEPGATLPL